MSTRSIILSEIETVARENEKTIAPLTDDLPLIDSGLDSLCFAILVARLEDRFGRDPFGEADASGFPNTVGELIALYDRADA